MRDIVMFQQCVANLAKHSPTTRAVLDLSSPVGILPDLDFTRSVTLCITSIDPAAFPIYYIAVLSNLRQSSLGRVYGPLTNTKTFKVVILACCTGPMSFNESNFRVLHILISESCSE